jgi:hypothetical protein
MTHSLMNRRRAAALAALALASCTTPKNASQTEHASSLRLEWVTVGHSWLSDSLQATMPRLYAVVDGGSVDTLYFLPSTRGGGFTEAYRGSAEWCFASKAQYRQCSPFR